MLTNDLISQLRSPEAICPTDARPCYNCVDCHAPASLASNIKHPQLDCLFTSPKVKFIKLKQVMDIWIPIMVDLIGLYQCTVIRAKTIQKLMDF